MHLVYIHLYLWTFIFRTSQIIKRWIFFATLFIRITINCRSIHIGMCISELVSGMCNRVVGGDDDITIYWCKNSHIHRFVRSVMHAFCKALKNHNGKFRNLPRWKGNNLDLGWLYVWWWGSLSIIDLYFITHVKYTNDIMYLVYSPLSMSLSTCAIVMRSCLKCVYCVQ